MRCQRCGYLLIGPSSPEYKAVLGSQDGSADCCPYGSHWPKWEDAEILAAAAEIVQAMSTSGARTMPEAQ